MIKAAILGFTFGTVQVIGLVVVILMVAATLDTAFSIYKYMKKKK